MVGSSGTRDTDYPIGYLGNPITVTCTALRLTREFTNGTYNSPAERFGDLKQGEYRRRYSRSAPMR